LCNFFWQGPSSRLSKNGAKPSESKLPLERACRGTSAGWCGGSSRPPLNVVAELEGPPDAGMGSWAIELGRRRAKGVLPASSFWAVGRELAGQRIPRVDERERSAPMRQCIRRGGGDAARQLADGEAHERPSARRALSPLHETVARLPADAVLPYTDTLVCGGQDRPQDMHAQERPSGKHLIAV
jgi:hypothetical protein